jgi:signal transduction histidine kinase/CheY-like chemotaxis protein
MKFKLTFWDKNGRWKKDEQNSSTEGTIRPGSSRRTRELVVFARLLKKAARRKYQVISDNGKQPFTRFQEGFAALTRRVGEAKALRSIQSKLKLPHGRVKQSLDRFHFWVGSTFRNKVLLPVIGCTVVVLIITFFLVKGQFTRQTDREARRTLATADAAFRYAQDFRRNDLLMRFHNLPNVPLWNQVFQSGAPRDLHNTLRNLMEMQKVDIVYYVSGRGKILDVVNNPGIPPVEFEDATVAAVRPALNGEEKVDTVRVAGKLYDVVTLPAYDSDNKQIGALALGSELGDAAVQAFSKLTQGQVALIADGRIVASTLPGLEANDQFEDILKGRANRSDMKTIVFNGVHYNCSAGSFASMGGDTTLGYVLLNSNEQSLVEKRTAQHLLAVIGLFLVLASGLVVWFFVDQATKPLDELRQGAESVGRGDFSRRVSTNSHDECGQLASVFNHMTESLEQSRSELEKTVETLKTTQQQLVQSEKLCAIGEFVAGVAHELNNPLTAVVGFSELLKEEQSVEKWEVYSDRILESSMRCKRIVQALLSFARRDKPERVPVSTNELIENVLDIVGYSLSTSNVEIVKELKPVLPLVMADSHQIQQVILNIIGNAQQAMEASQPRGRIRIATAFYAPNICITIEDNGPGIAPEHLPRIFDPFFTTKEIGKGTGLGLSLCYGFIKEHGGNITATSQVGKGAKFVIEIPAIETAAVVPTTVEAKKFNHGGGKRILIIDDEEPILSMIREDLSSHGYNVEVTTDGEKALRQLAEKRFDLAVCDWKMPGMGGRQIYDRLRDTDPKICQRMIFITGDVVNPQIRHFLKTENRPCVSKPFTLSEFHTAVENILGSV